MSKIESRLNVLTYSSSLTSAEQYLTEIDPTTPSQYYNLGSVLLEPNNFSLLENNAAMKDFKLLLTHNQYLAEHPKDLCEVFRSLYLYIHQYPFEIFQAHLKHFIDNVDMITMTDDIIFMLNKIKFYNTTEKKEIVDLLKCKDSKEALNNLSKLLFADIQFSRLIPLFYMFHPERLDYRPLTPISNTIRNIEAITTQLHYYRRSCSEDTLTNNRFKEDEDSDIDTLGGSFSIQCHTNDDSQSVYHNTYGYSSSQHTDYDSLSTQELKSRVVASGYKDACRDQMLRNLRERNLDRYNYYTPPAKQYETVISGLSQVSPSYTPLSLSRNSTSIHYNDSFWSDD